MPSFRENPQDDKDAEFAQNQMNGNFCLDFAIR